eukprot:gene16314-19403_t
MDATIEKLNKLAEGVRTGGPGSVRRKRKVAHKTTTVDDKKLQMKLSKLGVRPIDGIDEVNLFKTDGTIIHFDKPKVQTAQKTFVVTGAAENKTMQELLPGILTHLGTDSIANLQKMAEQYSKKESKESDDVPDLVGNFETTN